jgi:superfamily II RNA helicase
MSYSVIYNTNELFTGENPTNYYPFKYDLDHFQLHGCKAIDNGENVLITAHTGSGKTALALYAISRCIAQDKKVVYTSPIKTLSNQKFKEFSDSFPSVGILTGDVKINPTAQCIIMTAEILRNSLFRTSDKTGEIYDWNFNPDEISCVILDEVHFINNPERGKVWEEILINLSPKIQLVMLSATISGAKEMVDWLGDLKKVKCHLISTAKRPVPLTHSIYWNDKLYTYESDEIWINGPWNEAKKEIDKYYQVNRYSNHTFHKCLEYLKTNGLLPATVFLLNRDAVEKQAKALPNFQEEHMEVSRIKSLWDKHLLKYREIYQYTEQWNTLYDLVCKGIGIHHSGMIPILKEIVEILYTEGLLKVLLATETFALGVNSPTKTVVFTNLTKFDGTRKRLLRPEEYGQMAGRAGRRGLDKFGNVIILPTYDFISESEAKTIICAPPQKINSKLSLDYSLILKLLNYKLDIKNDQNPIEFISEILYKTLFNGQESMISEHLYKQKIEIESRYEKINGLIDQKTKDNKKNFERIMEINQKLKPDGFIRLDKKIEKKLINEKNALTNDIPNAMFKTLESLCSVEKELDKINNEIIFNKQKLIIHIEKMMKYLNDNEMIDESGIITLKGRIVSEVNECNPLIISKIISSNILDDLDFNQIAAIFSIFIADKEKSDEPIYTSDLTISNKEETVLKEINKWINDLEISETKLQNYIPFVFKSEWSTSLTMYEATKQWTNGKSWFEIKDLFSSFEGNFIKNILRLCNLMRNILSIARITKNIKLINTLEGFQEKLIKDIVTSDSLYL